MSVVRETPESVIVEEAPPVSHRSSLAGAPVSVGEPVVRRVASPPVVVERDPFVHREVLSSARTKPLLLQWMDHGRVFFWPA